MLAVSKNDIEKQNLYQYLNYLTENFKYSNI